MPRDTIPEVLEMVARHPSIDAVVYLGLGIQSNEAQLMKTGPFHPDHGIERIVSFHERQDARYAEAAAAVSDETGKPVLTATELGVTAPDNPGPAAVRASGKYCYPSANGVRPSSTWALRGHRAAPIMRTFLRLQCGSCPRCSSPRWGSARSRKSSVQIRTPRPRCRG